MDTAVRDMLVENAYIDAQEWLLSLNRPPCDQDMIDVPTTLMIDLPKAAAFFVQTFSGTNPFMDSLKSQFVRKGGLTIRQLRAALKVLQDELKAGRIVIASRDGRAEPIKLVENPKPSNPSLVTGEGEDGQFRSDESHRTQCYKCNKWFTSYPAVQAHKTVVHYRGTKAVAVLKDEEVEETHLDLSALPDGRYAAVDPSGKHDFLFFAVKTMKVRQYRDRKYRYGKFRIGHEWIEAGTVEVRLWSTDSKEWVGAQKPGEGYRGGYVDQLVQIMGAPAAWAMIFAHKIGCCSICGKTLTDELSRERGIGPDCYERWGGTYHTRWSRSAAITAAAAKAASATATVEASAATAVFIPAKTP